MEPRKRKRLLLAFAGILALFAGLWILFRDPEPSYQGKRLSEWISIYLAAETLASVKEARAAIQVIGTNALPILVDWIDYHPGPLRRQALTYWDNLPGGLRDHSTLQRWVFGGLERSGFAQPAFTLLRDRAAPAIPALHHLACDSRSQDTRRRAVNALCAIGPGAMTAMTNVLAIAPFDEQRLVLNSLVSLGTNAAPAIPALIHQLRRGDMRTAKTSADTLGRLRLDPDQVIPALIEGLADPNGGIRAAAARALGSFGAPAFIGLPALNGLVTDPDDEVSRAARDAITAITGVAPP